MAAQATTIRCQSTGASTSKSRTHSHVDPFINITRHHGVAFSVEDNVPIATYVDAITDTIDSQSVISASRISNGRAAVYMKTRQDVEDATMFGFRLKDSFVNVTPLVQPTTRLVLSNVYPELPNELLAKNLSSFCKVISTIRPIPLGIKNKKLSHVMSFRRQVHVLIDVGVTIPDHINITYSNVNYRVFLSNDSVKCFNCGENGHISKNCKKDHTEHNIKQTLNRQPDPQVNPLNPPPVFHHGKSDPKHPPKNPNKSSRPTVNPSPSTPTSPKSPIPVDPSPPRQANTTETGDAQNKDQGSSPSHDDTAPHSQNTPTSTSPTPQPSEFVSVWGSPPQPSRLFSEVVSKRKQPVSPSGDSPSLSRTNLVPLKTPSPPRKLTKQNATPTITQALDNSTPNPFSPTDSISTTATASVESDVESTSMEEPQDIDETSSDNLPKTTGPLSDSELLSFLKRVKSKKKPDEIARKYTNNIPGLVKQLKPLRNSAKVPKRVQHRIRKLVQTLDPKDPFHL